MKKLFTFFIITTLITISLHANEVKKYGNEVTLTEKTLISEIVANPESFVGKKVLVEGIVVGVCAKRGCWMNIASDKEHESIRIKVNDGEIVFPMEAKGKKALVEGEVYSIVVEGDGCSGDCKEDEREKDHECEHKKTTKKVYQIKGLGAIIQ